MISCREQIQSAIQATVFHSRSAYSWFGKPSPRLTVHFEHALSQKVIETYLLSILQFQLYWDFYCQGAATPSVREQKPIAHVNVGEFVDELSSSNCGAGYLAEGWQITSLPDNELIARRNGLAFRVQKNDCNAVNGELLDPTARINLRFPKELCGISPGFYMAVSDVEMPDSKDVSLVRFYWNLRPEGAVPLMQELTRELNHARLPFRFKVLNDRTAFSRCDAAVLYARKRDYEAVAQILERTYPKIGEKLNGRVPAFTKRLAPGLGLAEDPGNKLDSFGMHRCRLLAEGMFRAYQQDRESLADRLRIVEAHFAKHQISLESPFLNPGSADLYEFRINGARLDRDDSGEIRARPASYSAKDYLGAAMSIASRLTRQAIWHENRCNWVGFQPLERSVTPQANATLSVLGPDLYSGTSGVALFLGELCAATGDAELRRTALGAIAQALSRLDVLPAPARPSLFAGWIGIALVAARLGRILQDENLIRAALGIAQRCKNEKLNNWEFDLFHGKAGMIAGLLVLGELLDEPGLLDFCVPVAGKLLTKANKSKAGYSWPSSALPTSRNLTGFSHGAAGIGYALLELFHATGDFKYRKAAEAAFAYEGRWYDHSRQNWPDLREEPGQPKPNLEALPFATAWCHGAPGIALSRLRAYEILKDGARKAEALMALETTRCAVESWLHSPNANYSLCHGLAGNAEVLRYASAVLGPAASEASNAALDVGAKGIESFGGGAPPWPCGTPAGENPSLMLGLAGIGRFYLRLAVPSVPSILILRREDFSHQN